MSPALRTYEHCDIADRRIRQGHQLSRVVLRTMLGKMLFGAVELIPSESLYCSSVLNFLPEERMPETQLTRIYTKIRSWWYDDDFITNATRQPLLLWGLTLGITADFLGFVSVEGATCLWAWPTLSPWDIRSVIWIMTYSFRKRIQRESGSTSIGAKSNINRFRRAELGELDVETFTTTIKRSSPKSRLVFDEVSLDVYFNLVRKAIIITVSGRLVISSCFIALVVMRLLPDILVIGLPVTTIGRCLPVEPLLE